MPFLTPPYRYTLSSLALSSWHLIAALCRRSRRVLQNRLGMRVAIREVRLPIHGRLCRQSPPLLPIDAEQAHAKSGNRQRPHVCSFVPALASATQHYRLCRRSIHIPMAFCPGACLPPLRNAMRENHSRPAMEPIVPVHDTYASRGALGPGNQCARK